MNLSREQMEALLSHYRMGHRNLMIPKPILQARKSLSLKKQNLSLFFEYASELKRDTAHKILKKHYHSKLDLKLSSLKSHKLLPCLSKISNIVFDTTHRPGLNFLLHNRTFSEKKLPFKILKHFIKNSKQHSSIKFSKELPDIKYLELFTNIRNLKSLEITLGFHQVLVYPDFLQNFKRLKNLKLALIGNSFYSKKEDISAAFVVFFKYFARLTSLQHINLSVQDSSYYDNFHGTSQLLLALNQLPLKTFKIQLDLTTPQKIDFSMLNSLLPNTDCLQIFLLPQTRKELTPIEVKSSNKIIFNIFPKADADIASLITNSKSLTSLYIHSYDSMKPLKQVFSFASSLKKLICKFAFDSLNDGEIEVFLKCVEFAMNDVTALEELQINSTYIGAISIFRLGLLAQLAAIQKHLKIFGLDIETQMTFRRSEKPKKEKKVVYGNIFKDLTLALSYLKNLTDLKLHFNHYTLKPVQGLDLALIAACSKLRSLSLNMKLEGDFKETEFKFPFEKLKNLKELAFQFDQTWSKKSKEHFLEKILLLEKLIKISLPECSLDREKLMVCLYKLPNLQKVHIHDRQGTFISSDFQKVI